MAKKSECCGNVVRETELAKCLLWDHFSQSGAYHDADPLSAYRTERDGSVVFEQSRVVCPRYVPCKTADDVDRLVAKVLMAASKHARRHAVVSEKTLKGTLCRLPSGKTWHGRGLKVDGAVLTKALPRATVVHVGGFPEEFGRLCYDCSGYGVSIVSVHMLSVFKVVPEVTLGREPVRL